MTREEFLKLNMKKKYGSVKAFAEYAQIPYTTIRSILERGIGNSSVDNVINIAQKLNIPIEILENPDADFFDTLEENNFLINETIETLKQLSEVNKEKVLVYAKEQLIIQEAAK